MVGQLGGSLPAPRVRAQAGGEPPVLPKGYPATYRACWKHARGKAEKKLSSPIRCASVQQALRLPCWVGLPGVWSLMVAIQQGLVSVSQCLAVRVLLEELPVSA